MGYVMGLCIKIQFQIDEKDHGRAREEGKEGGMQICQL